MSFAAVIVGGAAVVGGVIASQGAKSAANTQARAADNAAAEQAREFDIVQGETQPYRDMGVNALNTLGRIYGYAPVGGATSTSSPNAPIPSAPNGPGGFPTASGSFGIVPGYDSSTGLPGYDPSSGYQITPSGGVNRLLAGGTAAPAGSANTNMLASPDYSSFFESPDYNFRKQQGMQGIENSFSASGGVKSGNALKALDEFNSNLASGEFGNFFNRQAALAGIGQTATGQSGNAAITTGANVGNSLIAAGNARASGVAGSTNAIGGAINGIGQGLGYYLYNRQPAYDPNTYAGGIGTEGGADYYGTLSDERAKTDKKRIGKTDGGLPIYRYRYKGSPTPQIGVMAQDVKKKNPSAVKKDPSGLLRVNYMGVR